MVGQAVAVLEEGPQPHALGRGINRKFEQECQDSLDLSGWVVVGSPPPPVLCGNRACMWRWCQPGDGMMMVLVKVMVARATFCMIDHEKYH